MQAIAHRHRKAVARIRVSCGPGDPTARCIDRRPRRCRIEPVDQPVPIRVARLHHEREHHTLEQLEVGDRFHHRRAVRCPNRHTDRRRRACTLGIDDRVREAVTAHEIRSRGVAKPSVLDHRSAVGRLCQCTDHQRLALGIEVVRQHVDQYRGTLIHRRHVGGCQRRAVRATPWQHRHREAAARLCTAIIGRDREHHIGTRFARNPCEQARGRIDARTGRRLIEPEAQRITVDVTGVDRQLERHTLDDHIVIDRCQLGSIVHPLHRHRHRRTRDVAGRIDDPVGEGIAAVEVRLRCVADLSSLDRHCTACRRPHIEQRDEVPVRVAVVRQHVDQHRGILGHGRCIGPRHGCHIHRLRTEEAHIVDAHRGVQRAEAEQVEVQRRLSTRHAAVQVHRHQHRLRQVDRTQRLTLQIGHTDSACAIHRATRLQVEERVRMARPDRADQ